MTLCIKNICDQHTVKAMHEACLCCTQVGAPILSRALARLPRGLVREDVLVGLEARDDAAIVRPPPPGHVMIQTVDFFRSFLGDAHEFGAVAANNALGVRLSYLLIAMVQVYQRKAMAP